MEKKESLVQQVKDMREWNHCKEETAQEVLELLRGKGLTHSQAKSVLVCAQAELADLGTELLKVTRI